MPTKLKVDDAGHAVVLDGRPVFIYDDGKEAPFDIVQTTSTISRLSGEAKGHRERAEAAESKLKAFDGITDAEAARKALDTIKNIDDGQLVAAGKVEEIKVAARKAAEEQIAALSKTHADELGKSTKERDKLQLDLHNHMIGGSFARSKLITDPKHVKALVIPADIAEARFGKHFRVEDGKVIAYDASGNKIFSRANPGEVAEFDEALETLVEQYPYKDQIMRSSGNTGDGARGGNGKGQTGDKTMLRSEFDKLGPLAKRQTVVDKILITD